MRRWGVIGLAAVGMIACERPTAPQVRDAADQVERNILSGDSTKVYSTVRTFLYFPAVYDTSRLVPSDTVRITRGDQELLLRATVMERVFLPPPGSDAQPVVHRMGVVWSADATHDPNRMRLVFLLMNDSNPRIVGPRSDRFDPSIPEGSFHQHIAQAVAIEPGDRHEWTGQDDGALTISDGVPVGSCPFAGNFARSPALVADLAYTTTPITCDTRRYTISLSATMEHNDPDGAMTELRITRQQTRGVRITTQCKGVRNEDPDVCWGFPKAESRR
jgi:hypothetical protein